VLVDGSPEQLGEARAWTRALAERWL